MPQLWRKNRIFGRQDGIRDGFRVREHCDGVCLEHFYKDSGVRPDFCVICEPSDNVITLGTHGKSAGENYNPRRFSPRLRSKKGINAVYEMAEIIQRVEALNGELQSGDGGTVVLSDISCEAASLNAVPSRCEIYLDRRLRLGEYFSGGGRTGTSDSGKRASWEPGICTASAGPAPGWSIILFMSPGKQMRIIP